MGAGGSYARESILMEHERRMNLASMSGASSDVRDAIREDLIAIRATTAGRLRRCWSNGIGAVVRGLVQMWS